MTAVDDKVVLEQVTMTFGDKVVTEAVDLRVRRHELLCVVGTSGGGKTTLLRATGGLLTPAAGEIRLDDEPITGPDPRIAIIFQHFGLFPWKTVRENVAYGLDVQGRDSSDGIVDRLIEAMTLTEWADAYPHQLSGGMQQRVGIARGFAVEPELLLMDEPFSALDALTREELQSELLRLWRSHPEMTAVLVTHDIDEAMLLGDRVVVLCGQPGQVTAEFDIPFPRPREPEQVRLREDYAPLRHRIWESLRTDDSGEAAEGATTTREEVPA